MTAPINVEFVSGTTITSDWLNGVNDHVNNIEADPHPMYVLDSELSTYVEEPTLASDVGATMVGYKRSDTGSTLRVLADKLSDSVSVKDFGALGDGVSNDTVALQAALDTGKSLYFPAGVYLTDPLTIPYSARGATYTGAGFYHYDNSHQTVIKARTAAQAHVFKVGNSGASGSDCLAFQHIRIDCDNKAQMGIDATYGAFFTMVDCGVYNYTNFGVYHKQGLARYSRVFMNTSPTTYPTAVGLYLYSDSSVTDSEFSGGGTPLKIVAGGNRIVNVWANTGAASCITLTPFDDSTTHINTSMVNVYAGEVVMSSPSGVRPIIEIVGTALQRVQEVQFSNSYIVTAASEVYKKNGGIFLDYCDAISISNIVMRGNGNFSTADLYCDYFIKAQRSKTITVTFNRCCLYTFLSCHFSPRCITLCPVFYPSLLFCMFPLQFLGVVSFTICHERHIKYFPT